MRQGCILSPYLFNLYVEYILKEAGLEKYRHGFRTGGRNINSMCYAGDSTLIAENAKDL